MSNSLIKSGSFDVKAESLICSGLTFETMKGCLHLMSSIVPFPAKNLITYIASVHEFRFSAMVFKSHSESLHIDLTFSHVKY